MGKRFNVFVSEDAYQVIKKFKAKNKIRNLDDALDQFIIKNKNA